MSTSPDNELAKVRQRVASEPTNLQYRFELGAALYERHDYAAALHELHQAMGSPSVRLRAMGLIAEVFDARGMVEVAARMREQMSKESGDEGDAGSAPIPAPGRPIAPLDSSGAAKIPNQDDSG